MFSIWQLWSQLNIFWHLFCVAKREMFRTDILLLKWQMKWNGCHHDYFGKKISWYRVFLEKYKIIISNILMKIYWLENNIKNIYKLSKFNSSNISNFSNTNFWIINEVLTSKNTFFKQTCHKYTNTDIHFPGTFILWELGSKRQDYIFI